MIIRKFLVVNFIALSCIQIVGQRPLIEQFTDIGYVEFCDTYHGSLTYDKLYGCFDNMVEFLQKNPSWAQKLYGVKERFIRSKNRNIYSTDFFGFYDESQVAGRSQISFYYSVHFHEFISSFYKEFNQVPEIINFFNVCFDIQKSYEDLFIHVTQELGLANIFISNFAKPPILFKVVKYLESYVASRPHYDGTAFSLFLDSTDHQSLLLSAYKSLLVVDDFVVPIRKFVRSDHCNSILLIPGLSLTEFSIFPTPHIVVTSGKVRYATIAFAMRPHYISVKNECAALPSFKI